MKLLLKIIILFIALNFCHGRTAENLRVHIQDGDILGRYMSSNSGKTIRAFMGIPFAAPPVGNLRFKPPQKPAPWTGQLNVQNPPPMCTQTIMIIRDGHPVFGQEDCLYLNVYAPEVQSKKKLPVMVWIHGGGWIFGYSTTPFYGPDYLLDQEVILVSGNYRLGALGFLSTEDEHCPGNMGFKDQVMVLKWVQDNIEQFGGDKNSVTIFGESAGSASVTLLMNSPQASKLFHRAIAHSGSLMDMWSLPHRKGLAKSRAVELAGMLGCSSAGSSSSAIVQCLRNVPAESLLNATYKFYKWDYDPVIPFGVVIEDPAHTEQPFLTDAFYQNSSSEIPFMVGVNSEEGLFKAVGMLNDPALLQDLQDNWKTAFPLTFYYDHLPKKQQDEISTAIYNFYFKNGSMSDNLDNVPALWSDGWMVYGVIENIQQRLKIKKHANTFVYLFSHKGTTSFTEWLGGDPEKFYGTCHLDELLYLFPMREDLGVFVNSIPSKEDLKLKDIMIKLWTNFARKGNPTPYEDYNLPSWLPASKFPLDYMRIGNNNGYSSSLLKMKSDLFSKSSNFWINLKKKYNLTRWVV